MINFNRFNSVISKFGDYSIRDYATLLNLMYNDIIEDLNSHYSELLNNEITKTIKRKISTFLIKTKESYFLISEVIMLRLILEIVPHGKEEDKKKIGEMVIINDSTGNNVIGN